MADARRAIERRLGPFVVLAGRLPKAVPFVVVVALLVGGLLAGGAIGAVLLLVLAAILALLLVLGWPALQPAPRLLRLAVVAVVVVRAVALVL